MDFIAIGDTTVDEFNSGLENQLSMLRQLRQAMLQEAIEGKLTAEWRKQNPKLISGENHASQLLEKIRADMECTRYKIPTGSRGHRLPRGYNGRKNRHLRN